MQFMLTVHGTLQEGDEFGAYDSREQMEKAMADTGAFNQKVMDAGQFVFAGGLLPASTAAVVDGTSGEARVTEGPYLQSEERIGGFWVLEVEDRETALRLAGEASAACRAQVEVRQLAGA